MKLSNRLTIADKLDYEDELEIEIVTDAYECRADSFYLTREKLVDLIAHLQEIIAK
jgi:hypothetical protein